MAPAVIEIHTLTIITSPQPAMLAILRWQRRLMWCQGGWAMGSPISSVLQVSSELKLREHESENKGIYHFVQHTLQDLLLPGIFLRLRGVTKICSVPEQLAYGLVTRSYDFHRRKGEGGHVA